jgi:predicted acyl esterase
MAENPEITWKTLKFGEEEIEVAYSPPARAKPVGEFARSLAAQGKLPLYVVNGFGDTPPLNPRTYDAGWGIVCEQDVAVPMRDGTITYADIYRPAGQKNLPCLISWSPYGKRAGTDTPEIEWQTPGVPEGSHSNNAKFEGPDPNYWCHKGYAICNYDPRGIGNSQGDIYLWSSQEGRDGYDLIEWLAVQEWCSGRISMMGNSALAMCQWRIAAEQPPHLTCIAPWEGIADIYREALPWGGFPESGFWPFLAKLLEGQNLIEDLYANYERYPLINAYWEDKIPDFTKIEIPAYITAGWSHFHLRAAIMGFRHISSKFKWLRAHRDFEWPDQYSKLGLQEATMFFDRYLKGIRNGWESTPRVRVDVMDAYDFDNQLLRGEKEFPLARTEYRKLYLDAANRSMSTTPVLAESSCHYAAAKEKATFDITFDEETELTGYMKLKLWVEADGNDDMDLFIAIRKLDPKGKWLPYLVLGQPHPGCPGKLRVSLREVDETHPYHSEFQPWHPFKNPQKLKPGEIVPVEIEIYPSSRVWHAGEQLQVEVMGHYARIDWFEPFDWNTCNKGLHIIHTGGKYDSYLLVPYVPPKYVAGNTVYR